MLAIDTALMDSTDEWGLLINFQTGHWVHKVTSDLIWNICQTDSLFKPLKVRFSAEQAQCAFSKLEVLIRKIFHVINVIKKLKRI